MRSVGGCLPPTSDDGRLLTASDGPPLHSQAKVTVGAMPAVMELTDGGVPPDDWVKLTDGGAPSTSDDECQQKVNGGLPMQRPMGELASVTDGRVRRGVVSCFNIRSGGYLCPASVFGSSVSDHRIFSWRSRSVRCLRGQRLRDNYVPCRRIRRRQKVCRS